MPTCRLSAMARTAHWFGPAPPAGRSAAERPEPGDLARVRSEWRPGRKRGHRRRDRKCGSAWGSHLPRRLLDRASVSNRAARRRTDLHKGRAARRECHERQPIGLRVQGSWRSGKQHRGDVRGREPSNAGSFPLWDVQNGGRMLVEDTWVEGGASRAVRLTGTGTFTSWGGNLAPYNNIPVNPVVELNGFSGRATFGGVLLNLFGNSFRGIVVTNETSQTNALFLGGSSLLDRISRARAQEETSRS